LIRALLGDSGEKTGKGSHYQSPDRFIVSLTCWFCIQLGDDNAPIRKQICASPWFPVSDNVGTLKRPRGKPGMGLHGAVYCVSH
jgi:hypothetical protein